MTCLYCLEELPDARGEIVTCDWCGCQYTQTLLVQVSEDFWNDLAFGRSQTHKLQRFNTQPPTVLVSINA